MDPQRPDSRRFTEIPIERVRAFWDRRPCNLRHSPSPVGTREYFDEVEARKYFVEPHIPRFAEFARWRGKRVLEIGCGIGTDTMNFARAGAEVTAVDLSPRSLELAQRRADIFGLRDRIRFLEADAERLDEVLAPSAFDLVYSFGVVHHSPHPERVLAQIRRHYVSGGSTLKLMVYNRWSWKTLSILIREGHGAFWRLDELVAHSSEAQSGSPVTYTYTPTSMRRLLADHRFDVTDLFVDHIFSYRVADYVQYQYVTALPFRWLPRAVMRALERRLGWHLCVTARPHDADEPSARNA